MAAPTGEHICIPASSAKHANKGRISGSIQGGLLAQRCREFQGRRIGPSTKMAQPKKSRRPVTRHGTTSRERGRPRKDNKGADAVRRCHQPALPPCGGLQVLGGRRRVLCPRCGSIQRKQPDFREPSPSQFASCICEVIAKSFGDECKGHQVDQKVVDCTRNHV